jgi:hypothetical protein
VNIDDSMTLSCLQQLGEVMELRMRLDNVRLNVFLADAHELGMFQIYRPHLLTSVSSANFRNKKETSPNHCDTGLPPRATPTPAMSVAAAVVVASREALSTGAMTSRSWHDEITDSELGHV